MAAQKLDILIPVLGLARFKWSLGAVSHALIACSLLTACGPTGDGTNDGSLDENGAFRLMPEQVFDPMVNSNAVSFLKPRGWERQGGVVWRHEMAVHASLDMTVHNPSTGDLLEFYPIVPYQFIPNPVTPIPTGTVYLGCIFLAPVTDLAFFLDEIYFKAFRSNATNAQVVSTEPLRKAALAVWEETYGAAPETEVRAVKWTVEYDMGDTRYEESFFCAVSYTSNPLIPGAVLWQPEYVYSIRAKKGRMDRAQGLLHAMASSLTLDLKWFALYLQVHKLWQDGQMQAIRSAGELSRYISNVNADITKTLTDGYRQRQASEDRIYDGFSESIRGVETYDNPVTGQTVQLPSDFSHAWVSSSGEFFLTNTTTDPNVGSNLTWQLLTATP